MANLACTGSGIKVCAKGFGSPGASSIRGRPRFRFIISGSKEAVEAVEAEAEARLRSVGSNESLGFLGLDALDGAGTD